MSSKQDYDQEYDDGTRAVAKYIRISPQKARLVADVVRGKDVDTALTTLRFMPKKAAKILRKVLESAVANAEQTETIDVDTLYVKEIQINGGPMLKRFRPRAMGRATRILKRTSHITVVVDEA
ncbi:50S ribosomal protein L22 [Desulfobulbus sp. US1]|nr:50S ribosomal protein L22 [Desulfobulbus sp. US1]